MATVTFWPADQHETATSSEDRGMHCSCRNTRATVSLKMWFRQVKDILDYHPDGISWQDQLAAPGIVEARRLYDGVLMGGIDHTAINYLPFSKLTDQIVTSKKQGGDRRSILAPGCVIPSHCPKRVVQFASKVVQAVD